MFYTQPPEKGASDAEMSAWAERECQAILTDLEEREMGIRVALAGLVWRVPLCHDGFDY
jgi:hypothetical protein